MKKIKWSENLNIGNANIDEQHQMLVNIVNHYIDAVNDEKEQEEVKNILLKLRDYTLQHFSAEEEFMQELGYPELEQHKKDHEKLTKMVKEYQEYAFSDHEVPKEEMIPFFKKWLLEHILQKDMDIARFAKQQEENK